MQELVDRRLKIGLIWPNADRLSICKPPRLLGVIDYVDFDETLDNIVDCNSLAIDIKQFVVGRWNRRIERGHAIPGGPTAKTDSAEFAG